MERGLERMERIGRDKWINGKDGKDS